MKLFFSRFSPAIFETILCGVKLQYFLVLTISSEQVVKELLLPLNHKVYVVTANCYDYDDSRKPSLKFVSEVEVTKGQWQKIVLRMSFSAAIIQEI